MGDFVPATVSVFHSLLYLACLYMYVCVGGCLCV